MQRMMPSRQPLPGPYARHAPSLRTELLPVDRLSAVLNADDLLTVFRFSGRTAIDTQDSRLVHIGLNSLDDREQVEAWWASGPVSRGSQGGIAYAEDGALLFGHLLIDEASSKGLAEATETAYRKIVRFLRQSAYPYVCRCWNFLPRINRIEDGLERYRTFCVGRHAALGGAPALERSLPAASAIGTGAPGLLVSFIASRVAPLQIENPRQVSAFHYPPQHGPRSPLFSRAVWMDWETQPRLYLSGTASILGHETVHPGDPAAQLAETLRNIDATRANAPGFTRTGAGERDQNTCLRVYLRHAKHYKSVRDALAARVGSPQAVTYLRGDICRSDLVLEIEGVFGPSRA